VGEAARGGHKSDRGDALWWGASLGKVWGWGELCGYARALTESFPLFRRDASVGFCVGWLLLCAGWQAEKMEKASKEVDLILFDTLDALSLSLCYELDAARARYSALKALKDCARLKQQFVQDVKAATEAATTAIEGEEDEEDWKFELGRKLRDVADRQKQLDICYEFLDAETKIEIPDVEPGLRTVAALHEELSAKVLARKHALAAAGPGASDVAAGASGVAAGASGVAAGASGVVSGSDPLCKKRKIV